MTRQILFMLMFLLSIVARSQSADALYDEGKKLYDAKKYEQAFKKLLPDTNIYYLDGDYSPKKVKSLGLKGIDYHQNALRSEHPEWLTQAQELGVEVNVWTVDNPEMLQYYIDKHVDYITTNKPVELQGMLRK